MRLAPVRNFSDLEIIFRLSILFLLPVHSRQYLYVFERNDSPRLLVCCELKIVQTVVIEDEPPPLPALVPAALLPQPALLVGVEEGVHQVIAVVLRDLERLRLDATKEIKLLDSVRSAETGTFHRERPAAPWGDSRHH